MASPITCCDQPAGADDAAQRSRRGHRSQPYFEERTNINTAVVAELTVGREGAWNQEHHATLTLSAAMEKQMRAEREKRAVILTSEGQRDTASTPPRARSNRRRSRRRKRATQRMEPEGEAQAKQILGRGVGNRRRHPHGGAGVTGGRRHRSHSWPSGLHGQLGKVIGERRHHHPAVEPRRYRFNDHGDECG